MKRHCKYQRVRASKTSKERQPVENKTKVLKVHMNSPLHEERRHHRKCKKDDVSLCVFLEQRIRKVLIQAKISSNSGINV